MLNDQRQFSTGEFVKPEELNSGNLVAVGRSYQRVLDQDPGNAVALVGMSLVALASQQFPAAIGLAQVAVSVQPEMKPAWVALGQAYKAADQLAEAETAYRQALSLDGMDVLALMGMGELKIAVDDAEASAHYYEMALRKNPAQATAHLGLGHARACMGKFTDALQCYEQVLELRPGLPEAEYAAGYALVRMGKLKEAEDRYRRALQARPDFAAAWLNMGSLLREQGRDLYAQAALERALELRPDLVGAWLNMAVLERDRKNYRKAEEYLRSAFALDPGRVDTQVTWAQFRCQERDLAGAWAWLRWAGMTDSTNSEVFNMEGILHHTEGHYEQAVAAFLRAEELGNRAAASNRGNSLLDLGRVDEALEAHRVAVRRDPENPGAHYNLSMTQLRIGDYEHGWAGYESRWDFREVHRVARVFRQPRWKGEALAGRRILIHAEQGLGDSIQFCRYVKMVVERGGAALLQLQSGVMRLLESLEAVRDGRVEIFQLSGQAPSFDLECPLLSLPAVFETRLNTVPWDGPYLSVDPETAFQKGQELDAELTRRRRFQPRLKIGIAWAGNPGYKADHVRSTQLKSFLPLLRMKRIFWVALQKGEPARQIAELPAGVCLYDACKNDRDMADTAAVIANLDMVITTDTSIAHLAGAMGKPVWILLPHLADWRWMLDREDTPWYPTARLLRQRFSGDWTGLVQRVIRELKVREF